MKNDNWSRDTDDFSSAPSCLLHNSSDFSPHISLLSAVIFYCLTRKHQFHTCFLLTVTELTLKKRQHGPNFPFFLFSLLFWCMNILFIIPWKNALYFQPTAPVNLWTCACACHVSVSELCHLQFSRQPRVSVSDVSPVPPADLSFTESCCDVRCRPGSHTFRKQAPKSGAAAVDPWCDHDFWATYEKNHAPRWNKGQKSIILKKENLPDSHKSVWINTECTEREHMSIKWLPNFPNTNPTLIPPNLNLLL